MHLVRDMLAHCRRDQRGLVSAALREVFNAEDQAQARERIGHVPAGLEPACPKVCRLLEGRRRGPHRLLHAALRALDQVAVHNPLERANKEIGRRSDVVGIFPNDAAVIRLVALLSEQSDERLVQRRYLSTESMAQALEARRTEPMDREQGKEVIALTAA